MSSNDAPAKLSQMADSISVKGAREHNPKNISVDIPRNQLVIHGAMARIIIGFRYDDAEGYRKYIDSLSTKARMVLSKSSSRRGLHPGPFPVIALEQRNGEVTHVAQLPL